MTQQTPAPQPSAPRRQAPSDVPAQPEVATRVQSPPLAPPSPSHQATPQHSQRPAPAQAQRFSTPPTAQPPAQLQQSQRPRVKEIATLPPLQHLSDEVPPSPRTGEPRRPALVLVAMLVFLLSAAATAVTYGHHWWLAVHPDSYASSARLIQWLEPQPGKWLALTLEGVLAVVAALVAGVTGAVGFQAWNGWRWSKWAGPVAVALSGAVALLFDWVGFVAVGLAAVGAVLLFMPPITEFFTRFEVHRGKRPPPYRRPERVFYGRLPRYR
ncbi:hypothetical protein GCM10028820_13190 [Tessaracoccus terricola]